MTPKVRLVLRAVAVGAGTAGSQLQASASWDSTVVRAAAIGGGLAALEVFTPLNALVGAGKKP